MARLALALAGASVCGALALPQAAAEPGLEDEVDSPIVVAGASELSLRVGALVGGETGPAWRTRGEIGYAYLSWWRVGLGADWQRENDEDELLDLSIESQFDFMPSRRWPVHFGAYAEYSRNMQEDRDHVELKLLMQRLRGPLDLRFDFVTERDTGEGAENRWKIGYGVEASYRVVPSWRLGWQGFGDLGFEGQLGDIDEYARYWGPFVEVRLANVREQELGLHLGYLIGSGGAGAEGQVRLQLEWSFNEDTDD